MGRPATPIFRGHKDRAKMPFVQKEVALVLRAEKVQRWVFIQEVRTVSATALALPRNVQLSNTIASGRGQQSSIRLAGPSGLNRH